MLIHKRNRLTVRLVDPFRIAAGQAVFASLDGHELVLNSVPGEFTLTTP